MSDDASTALETPEPLTTVECAGRDVFTRAIALSAHLALSGFSRTSRAFALGVNEATTSLPRIEYIANATADVGHSLELQREITALFRQWQELRFEDGMENDLSRRLWRLLMTHSTLLVEALAAVIVTERVSPRVAAEALRHLGRFAHPPSHRDRLWLLERGLRSASPVSRDGASLGLAHLNDPSAIPYLQAAIEREPVASLRDDLRQVLDALQHDAASDQTR
jgi:hypothetical protein